MIPEKIESKIIDDITFSITQTELFYDVVAEGSLEAITRLKLILKLESGIIKKSVYGSSLIVIDTTTLLKDARYLFNETIKRYLKKTGINYING
jgi:hypothetical protein